MEKEERWEMEENVAGGKERRHLIHLIMMHDEYIMDDVFICM